MTDSHYTLVRPRVSLLLRARCSCAEAMIERDEQGRDRDHRDSDNDQARPNTTEP